MGGEEGGETVVTIKINKNFNNKNNDSNNKEWSHKGIAMVAQCMFCNWMCYCALVEREKDLESEQLDFCLSQNIAY